MLRVALRKLAAPAAAAAGVATAGGAVHAQEERRRPAAGACFGDAARCSAAAASPAEAAIPLWQTAANLVAANPFKSVFGVAAPLYAAIFAYECSSPATKDLPLSQRLIHTRVYGQAIAIGATIAVMAILNAQEKRGGLPYGQTEAKPKQSELTRLYDGTMRRASGSSSLPQGLHDRQAWAADNVDNYGLKMEQAQVIVPLLYMPAFPLTFILLRSRVRPETLNKVMASMIAIAASHAAWIQFGAALLLG